MYFKTLRKYGSFHTNPIKTRKGVKKWKNTIYKILEKKHRISKTDFKKFSQFLATRICTSSS
jgi:hypothetical protein